MVGFGPCEFVFRWESNQLERSSLALLCRKLELHRKAFSVQ